ncbi:MAG: hypothetical protein QOH85_832 [Acidobacteriaceae bacterium]|jgi:hypothetical protein|nr:hypothetical protein [Acidobacteriaceae bacterium]
MTGTRRGSRRSRSFNDLNNALRERLSDHAPITVNVVLRSKIARAEYNPPQRK